MLPSALHNFRTLYLIKVKIAKGWTLLIAMISYNLSSTGLIDQYNIDKLIKKIVIN